MLDNARFQPPAKRLPDLPVCPGAAAERASEDAPVPHLADDERQCVYRNPDGTWSRTHSTDHLVRQENLKEYPPLARALRALGGTTGYGVRTVVDAGANDGLSTRLFSIGLPEARVIALEPALANYAMLVRNTHKLPAVTPLRAALWNSSTALAVSGDATWSMSVRPTDPAAASGSGGGRHVGSSGGHASGELPGITVASLLEALCAPAIDFLKMDIEGAEQFVLVPGSASWLRRVKVFYMEAHAWARDKATGASAVKTSVQALLNAGMTVLTNPNLTMATWMPSQPKRREYVFLACHPEHVTRRQCMGLCESWRAGTGLGCEYVNRKRQQQR